MTRPTLALCIELPATAVGAPERVQLIPAGPRITGRDGRAWTFDAESAAAVLAAFAAGRVALPIDRNHANELKAPKGEESPAAGWIESLSIEDGSLWGAVTWTERGRNEVSAREYRYLSPAFDYDPTTGRVSRLVSAGLTNSPNLHLQALNHREESPMNRSAALVAAIMTALGLAADAADDAVATAINAIKAAADDASARALNAEKAQPSLDRYVPRADYDALVARATNAENAIQARDAATHQAAVDTAIGEALTAGKITPATEAYHRASCADAAGLERFRAFCAAAPEIGGASGLGTRQPDTGKPAALNAAEAEACRLLGISQADFTAARAV
jgi:phage I-like protein